LARADGASAADGGSERLACVWYGFQLGEGLFVALRRRRWFRKNAPAINARMIKMISSLRPVFFFLIWGRSTTVDINSSEMVFVNNTP